MLSSIQAFLIVKCIGGNEGLHVCAQCFVVSTLVSMTPAGPFLFRNYELPEAAQAHAKQVTDLPCFLRSNALMRRDLFQHTA